MSAGAEALDADLRQGMQEILQLCASNGLKATVTSTIRTYQQQKYLWERYQAGNSPLPAVPPGHSAHEYGWAFDMVVVPSDAQLIVGGWWQTYWGGTFGGKRDPVHFELPGAGKYAYQLGEQSVSAAPVSPTLWDYGAWALSLTSLVDLLFELGYVVASREEAEKILRALHIDPQGRIF